MSYELKYVVFQVYDYIEWVEWKQKFVPLSYEDAKEYIKELRTEFPDNKYKLMMEVL